MSREYAESTYDQIQGVITRLQSPVADLPTLLGLLASPLDALKLLPPKFLRYNASSLPPHGINVSKHIPLLQRALLEHVLPVWGPLLDEEKCYDIARQYFAPDLFMMSLPVSKSIAICAYDTILSLSITEHSVRMLTALAGTYPIDVLWASVFSNKKRGSKDKGLITWEDCVRNVAAVPGKVANAFAGKTTAIPAELETGLYFNSVSTRSEILINSLPSRPSQGLYYHHPVAPCSNNMRQMSCPLLSTSLRNLSTSACSRAQYRPGTRSHHSSPQHYLPSERDYNLRQSTPRHGSICSAHSLRRSPSSPS